MREHHHNYNHHHQRKTWLLIATWWHKSSSPTQGRLVCVLVTAPLVTILRPRSAADPAVAFQHGSIFLILFYITAAVAGWNSCYGIRSGRSNLAQLHFPHLISQLLSQEQHRTRIPGVPVQSCPRPNFDTLWKKNVDFITCPGSCFNSLLLSPDQIPSPDEISSTSSMH